MRIIEEKYFSLNGNQFIARRYKSENRNSIYAEIVYKSNGTRPANMKDIARQYLKPYNIEISTDANKMITHNAIKILMSII